VSARALKPDPAAEDQSAAEEAIAADVGRSHRPEGGNASSTADRGPAPAQVEEAFRPFDDEIGARPAPADIPSFIETQLPVSRLSKESYKERKANYSQTLTGLGKWWGRKPLVMVRAVILGLLMPASADPRKDREVFLALLIMDEDGLRRRKTRNIPLKEVWRQLTPSERAEWFAEGAARSGRSSEGVRARRIGNSSSTSSSRAWATTKS